MTETGKAPRPATFSEGVADLVGRLECIRVGTGDERDQAHRLRYASYLHDGVILPNEAGKIVDRYDELENNPTFLLKLDGRPAATIRLGVCSPQDDDVPAMSHFGDHLKPLVEAGATLVDPTRFVVDKELSIAHPKLVYATLRLAWVFSDHLEADYTLATVRREHMAFYRRFFGHDLVCEPREYLALVKPLGLMVLPCHASRERGYARYPFLRSERSEYEAMAA